MAFRDILLFMTNYPRRTPGWAIEQSCLLAQQSGARLSAALCQTQLPQVGNWLAEKLVHANDLIAAENRKSRDAAEDILKEFASRVADDLRGEQMIIDCGSVVTPAELSRRARVHDLTVVPIEPDLEYRVVAEGLIFESGRPVLLMPQAPGAGRSIQSVMIGWDGGRTASRALADAMPFCRAARSVKLLRVTGEKQIDANRSFDDILRHLRLHGVEAEVTDVAAQGRDAGSALMTHCIESGADLLVMGAYGHSRTREFVLGGATRSVLNNPQLPVLLSH